MDKKFATSEIVKKELEQKVESLEKALADKEKEIKKCQGPTSSGKKGSSP